MAEAVGKEKRVIKFKVVETVKGQDKEIVHEIKFNGNVLYKNAKVGDVVEFSPEQAKIVGQKKFLVRLPDAPAKKDDGKKDDGKKDDDKDDKKDPKKDK